MCSTAIFLLSLLATTTVHCYILVSPVCPSVRAICSPLSLCATNWMFPPSPAAAAARRKGGIKGIPPLSPSLDIKNYFLVLPHLQKRGENRCASLCKREEEGGEPSTERERERGKLNSSPPSPPQQLFSSPLSVPNYKVINSGIPPTFLSDPPTRSLRSVSCGLSFVSRFN